jgi:hypothetical protein
MNKIYSALVLPFILMAFNFDCKLEFECKSVQNSSKTNYSLELKLKEGLSEDYTLELYDLNTGVLVTKKKVFFSSGESKMVFENLKPSTYTVYFSSASCSKKKSLKGTGIVLQ